MQIVILLLTILLSSVQAAAFTESTELWDQIDRVNNILTTDNLNPDTLETLFQTTIQLALNYELTTQFEDLRADAYNTNDFTLINEYVNRASTSITVLVMGESNNIGVNVTQFLKASPPNTEAHNFFTLCISGFYTDTHDRPGTAEFPVWITRTHSSFQGTTDQQKAEESLNRWTTLQPSLNGYFLLIANATIDKLTVLLNQ